MFSSYLPAQNGLPVFKQITHPFMPSITSDYFFFSEDGLMWFSTVKGLSSFDGSEIIYYSTNEESYKYFLNSIRCMAEDAKHNFYIGTSMNLVYYDRRTKKYTELKYTYKDTKKTESLGPLAIFIDRAGSVYAGTGMHSLFIYNPGTRQMEHFNQAPDKPDSWEDKWFNTVASFASHSTDSAKLWIGTYHGIYLFDKKSKTFSQNFEIVTPLAHKYAPQWKNEKQGVTVEKMDVADDSTIWFNSWAGGFGHYNTRTGKVTLFFRDAVFKSEDRYNGYIITRFAKYSAGKYLLGIFDPHPGIYDTRTGKLDFINLGSDANAIDEVRFVTNDKQGNLWLMSKGQLFAALPDYYQIGSIPAKGQMRGVYFDKVTNQYYATPYGIYVFDTTFQEVKHIPVPLINNYYTVNAPAFLKITKDGSDRFWATGVETYILLPDENKFNYIWQTLPQLAWIKTKGDFFDVITDKKGNIFLSRTNGVVYYIDHLTLHADTIQPLRFDVKGSYSVKTMPLNYDSVRNKLYLSTDKSIAQFDVNSKEQRLIKHEMLFGNASIDNSAIDYSLDAEGRLWIWIPGYGIRIIEPENLFCIDSMPVNTRGFINGDFTSMRYGGKDRMLFQSGNGVIVYNYKKKQSVLLDKKNGLSAPVTMYMAYCNNYLWIGQRKNIEYFNIDNLNKLSEKMSPALNTIFADTMPVYIRSLSDNADETRLKYYQNNLSFSFSATEFFFPERIEYAYQLIPLEKKWHYTNYFNRKITYTKLSPGKYIFRLKSQMLGDTWDIKPVEYTIIIIPAWWQTSWFKVLCIVAAIGIFIYFIQRRIQFIRKTERQKLRHEKELMELEAKALRAQMNPHFIFNSLNSIKSLINKNENDKAAGYLTTFSKLIRTLFQNSDKREVSLFEELETCKLYTQLERMRFGDKVKFIFDVDESIDLKDIKVPALILQPFIENAIWHGLVPKENGGKVIVSVKENNGTVECIIDDDGIGRELSKKYKAQYEATHQSRGIGLTQSRLELDKLLNEREDTISIIDKKDEDRNAEGTKVVITFKENEK